MFNDVINYSIIDDTGGSLYDSADKDKILRKWDEIKSGKDWYVNEEKKSVGNLRLVSLHAIIRESDIKR